MGRLRDEDLRAILGPDFVKIIEAEFNSAKPRTLAEVKRSREKEADRLSDLRFTMIAILLVGVSLDLSSWHQHAGLDIQAWFGIAAILVGAVGMILFTQKRRSVLKAPLPQFVSA